MKVYLNLEQELYPATWVVAIGDRDGRFGTEVPDDLARRALDAAEQFFALGAELDEWFARRDQSVSDAP